MAFDLTDAETGARHPIVLSGGLWHGDVMLYDFMLPDHGLAGKIECDWRSTGPRYTLEQGEVTSDWQRRAVEAITQLLRPFFRGTFVGLSDEQLASLYPGDYHEGSGYCDEASEIEELKRHPAVQALLAEFPEAEIRGIRPIDGAAADDATHDE